MTKDTLTEFISNSASLDNEEETVLSLSCFWQRRNHADQLIFDKLTVHNISFLVAFTAYRLKITANQISVVAGLCSLFAMIAAATMDASDALAPILSIFVLSQISYVMDCADGQLARTTDTTSPYGAFLDRSMDLVAIKLQYGAFFVFMYRHFLAMDSMVEAQLWLFGGLIYLFFALARFTVWQFFLHQMPEVYESSKTAQNVPIEILKNLMDHQAALVSMLTFFISPVLCALCFTMQTLLLGAAWLRYFTRGRK